MYCILFTDEPSWTQTNRIKYKQMQLVRHNADKHSCLLQDIFMSQLQRRIQDFSDRGVSTSKVGVQIYYLTIFFMKNA